MALSDTKSIVPRGDQQGTLGTSSKSWGQIFVENPTDGGAAAANIANNDVDQIALGILGQNTTNTILDLRGNVLTTGSGVKITTTHNPADTENANNISSTNTFIGTGTSRFDDFKIDLNKTGVTAAGKSATITGVLVDIDDTATNVGTVNSYGIAINNNFTSTGGTVSAYGLYTNVGGGDNNYDIYMENSADSTEFAALQVGQGGMLTVSTTSDDETGKIILDADGDIEINADGGDIVFKDDNTTLATLGSNGLDTYVVHLPIQGSVSGETSGASDAGAYLVPQTTVNKHNIWGNAAGLVAFDSDLVINNNQSFATHSVMFCNSAGKVKSMDGVLSSNNVGQRYVFELWKGTPPNDQTAAETPVTVVLLATMNDDSTGNSEINTITAATINGTGAYAAGDVLFLTVRLATNNTSTTGFFRIGIELLNTPN